MEFPEQTPKRYTKENLPDDIEQLKEIILRQSALLVLLNRYSFGSKSERYTNANQANLFDEVEASEAAVDEGTAADVFEQGSAAAEPEGDTKKKLRRPQIAISDKTPRETIRHDLPAEDRSCPCCQQPMAEIGTETSEKIKVVPTYVVVEEHVYPKYACQNKTCDTQPQQAEREATVFPKIKGTIETLAFIAIQKYLYALPLHRLEYFFKILGVSLSRYVMSLWMIKLAEVFKPIHLRLEELLLSGNYLHMDETRLQVLREPGREATSLSQMWVRCNGVHSQGPPIVLFHYSTSRCAAVADSLLTGFKGYLQTDDYAGYECALEGREGITHLLCWDHARRYFWNAYQAIPKAKRANTTADQMLKLIAKLYKAEEKAKPLSDEERAKARAADSTVILKKIKKLCEEKLPLMSASSPTATAINYTLSNWDKLNVFLTNGRLNISNSPAEQSIRPFAVGRKNWLFANTPRGAEASAIIYSIIQTAKLNGLDPQKYLCNALRGLARKDVDINDLLPLTKPLVH